MGRTQRAPDFYVDQKDLASRVAKLENFVLNTQKFLLVPGAPTRPTVSIGTPRQPSIARPVYVMGAFVAAASTQMGVYMDASTSPTTEVEIAGSGGSTIGPWYPFGFWVPPAYYYVFKNDAGSGSLFGPTEITF